MKIMTKAEERNAILENERATLKEAEDTLDREVLVKRLVEEFPEHMHEYMHIEVQHSPLLNRPVVTAHISEDVETLFGGTKKKNKLLAIGEFTLCEWTIKIHN